MSVGAQIGLKALQTWCLALKQLLYVQQQQLLLPQQRHEKQQQHRQQQQQKLQQMQQIHLHELGYSTQGVGGFISDDNQNDVTIGQLMQALPLKKYSSSDDPAGEIKDNEVPNANTLPTCDRLNDFLSLDDDLDEGDDGAVPLKDGENEDFEEDLEDWIENGDTP